MQCSEICWPVDHWTPINGWWSWIVLHYLTVLSRIYYVYQSFRGCFNICEKLHYRILQIILLNLNYSVSLAPLGNISQYCPSLLGVCCIRIRTRGRDIRPESEEFPEGNTSGSGFFLISLNTCTSSSWGAWHAAEVWAGCGPCSSHCTLGVRSPIFTVSWYYPLWGMT